MTATVIPFVPFLRAADLEWTADRLETLGHRQRADELRSQARAQRIAAMDEAARVDMQLRTV